MPDAARKWLERQANRDIWPDNDYIVAVDIIRRLLAENEQLEADRRALVAYVHLYGKYVKEWMNYIDEIDGAEYPDFSPIEVAWQALGAELQEAIDGD